MFSYDIGVEIIFPRKENNEKMKCVNFRHDFTCKFIC